MAHLHNFAEQAGIVMGALGQKVKQTAQIACDIQKIYEIGSFMQNALSVVAPIAALVCFKLTKSINHYI